MEPPHVGCYNLGERLNSINFVVRTDAFEQNGILSLVLHKLKDDTQVITRTT